MKKWKCGICGNCFDNFHAQGFNHTIYCPLCYYKELYKRENKKVKKKVLTYYDILCYIIIGYDDNQKESEIK